MDPEKLKDKIKKDIRALLISAPRGVPMQVFPKDYRQMNGKEVPYRDLGYRSLEDFIMSIPDVVRIGTGATGFLTYFPVATRETQNIISLIARQKKQPLKKSVMPSPITARKVPAKMSAFSRRGGYGARPSPRGGGAAGGNRRPQAKYIHPRAQFGTYQPNLPPRLQPKSYPHQPSRPLYPSQPPHQPSRPLYPSQPPHQPSRPLYPSQPPTAFSSSFDASPSYPTHSMGPGPPPTKSRVPGRSRLASAPEISGSRLHPQHILASISSSTKVPSTSGTSTRSSNLSNLWVDDFKTATRMTIEEMNTKTKVDLKCQFQNPVCVEGFAGRHKEDEFQGRPILKLLLRAALKKGRPDFFAEAVLLHFASPHWDLKNYPDPYDLTEGMKLKVYGTAFAPYSKQKEKAEPSVKVHYYEKVLGSGSTSSSSQSSPRESRSSTPKTEVKTPALPSSSGNEEFEENIFKLLLKFERGTYARRLGKVYHMEWKMAPPDNILDLARALPFVVTEKVTDTDEMMYMKEEYRKRRSYRPEQAPPSTQPSEPASVAYTPPPPPPPSPPPLPNTVSFPEETRLYEVLVSFVTDPFSFYVQIKDDSALLAKFTEMEEQMNKHFKTAPKKALVVEVDRLYASLYGDEAEGQWCRALVVDQQESQVNVLFPDYGNQEWVSASDLRDLPPRLFQLPFQAIQCCLHGVQMKEKMMSAEAVDYFADLAADKICMLQVMDSSGGRVAVELLDIDSEEEKTINHLLIRKFHPITSLSPKLPSKGEPMVAVKLTDIYQEGMLSVQVVGPGLAQLEELTKQIEKMHSAKRALIASKVKVGGVYCTKYSMDKSWYRVRVMEELPSKKVLVEYIDYGNEEVTDRMKLRIALDTELFSLPPQAVRCKLAGIPPPTGTWTESATECLVKYIDAEDLNLEVVKYCIKVTSASSTTLPVVKLHMKNDAQEMICVNDTLLDEPQLFGLPPVEEDSLPQPPVVILTMSAPSSESSPSGGIKKEGRGEGSERIFPHTPREALTYDGSSEAGSDTVFENQLPGGTQQPASRGSSSASSSTHGGFNQTPALQPQSSIGSPGSNITEALSGVQINEESFESSGSSNQAEYSSISSLEDNQLSNVAQITVEASSNDVSVGSLPSSAQTKPQQHSPQLAKKDPWPVLSPIKDRVLNEASPVQSASVQPGHLALPPLQSAASSSSSTSLCPSQAESLYPKLLSPISPNPLSAPTTPQMSPPPVPTTPQMSPPPVLLAGSVLSGAEVEGAVRWEELTSGKLVKVEVTWAASPSVFTLQLLSGKTKLELMTEELNRLANLEPCPSPQSLCAGFLCAAKYRYDRMWYRAIVTQLFPESMLANVEFVDYGGCDQVLVSELKRLPEKCRHLPLQGIKASIGVRPAGEGWSPAVMKAFQEMVLNKTLFAVKDKTDSLGASSVTLLDTSRSSGDDVIINKLISQMLAKE